MKCRKMTKASGWWLQKGTCSKCETNKTKFIKQQKRGDFTNLLNVRMARIKLLLSKFWGEIHLSGHNFTGPGTRLDMMLNSDNTPKSWSRPISRVDGEVYWHDLAYLKHSDIVKRNDADRKMIKELDDIEKSMTRERTEQSIVKRILKTKVNVGFNAALHRPHNCPIVLLYDKSGSSRIKS